MKRNQTPHNLPVISLFSGAMGLDLGLESAGFSVVVAVESNKYAVETIQQNRPELPVIQRRIEDVTTEEILSAAGLKPGDPVVVSGGPSCQTFSTAGKRGSLGDPRGNLFIHFLRVVREAKPRFFIMENVRGVLSAAVKHRPLKERGPGYPALEPDEELGSAFRVMTSKLEELDYYVIFDVLNAADYGVPQQRQRLVVIGSLLGENIRMPKRTHSKTAINGLPTWRSLSDAIGDLEEIDPEFSKFSPIKEKYFKQVPEGGNWRDLPSNMQQQALGKAFASWGGRSGFFRRLSLDQPSPALTTHPDGKATSFCHPKDLRPLSVREYARVQQFPDTWAFSGTVRKKYEQIGNAVPLGLGEAIGNAVQKAMRSRKKAQRKGKVQCWNIDLLAKLSSRPRTILNPPRVRNDIGKESLVEWLGDTPRYRDDVITYVAPELSDDLQRLIASSKRKRGSSLSSRQRRAVKITERLKSIYCSPRLNNKHDPIDELYFIILSQMTTGPSYERVFDRLREAISSWDDLAEMSVHEVVEIVSDAGLVNQKAPRIIQIAQMLKNDFGHVTLAPLESRDNQGVENYLTKLPGVGTKTAKCVMMYSMDREVLPIDTHVARISCRLGLLDQQVPIGKQHAALEAVVPPTSRYDFHVNAIAHGRAVCRAKHPNCGECSLSSLCIAGKGGVFSSNQTVQAQ